MEKRFPFVAHAEVIQENASAAIGAKVTEISLYGCYLEFTAPLRKGAHVVVKIFTGSDFFEANASVVYSQPNLGTGLAFRGVKPHFAAVLQKWLT